MRLKNLRLVRTKGRRISNPVSVIGQVQYSMILGESLLRSYDQYCGPSEWNYRIYERLVAAREWRGSDGQHVSWTLLSRNRHFTSDPLHCRGELHLFSG